MEHARNSLPQIFIESLLRRALKDIKKSPQRSTRNLVDMALNFANGRFQKNFFESAQKMLCDERSAYYDLVQDIAQNIDENRIITFGINVGYTSCTLGAKTIREIEQTQGFDIPWALTLFTDIQKNPCTISANQSVITQGKELGIYTWLIFENHRLLELLPLIKNNPDCAFVLFCHAEELTDNLLQEAKSLYNLMFVVEFEHAAKAICLKLREQGFLYSVYVPYGEEDAGMITSGGMLYCTEALHPVFTFFIPDFSCPKNIQQVIYNYIKNTRIKQKCHTIPLDLIYDNLCIDSIISNDACTAFFDSNGYLFDISKGILNPDYCLFKDRLSDILKASFPKSEKKTST